MRGGFVRNGGHFEKKAEENEAGIGRDARRW